VQAVTDVRKWKESMPNVLVTGVGGFVGSALCNRLSSGNNLLGIYHQKYPTCSKSLVLEQADLLDFDSINAICDKYSPETVIHCAGLAHQRIGGTPFSTYMRVNSEVTENLAKEASKSNPDACFIFLSSVSVYGEENLSTTVSEDETCKPSGDYAVSKLDAERRLLALYDRGTIRNLIILRLAPVYDRDWSFNLNRRVLGPMNVAYIRFGSGVQKMSALAKPNLVDFIEFLMERSTQPPGVDILNVCDAEDYQFNTIIRTFKKSGVCPNKPVIPAPLFPVWVATRIAGYILRNKREWIHSCYDKLASDLVFDNRQMLETGFMPRHSLETIFDPQID